jgi:predicted aspartyl protease
MLSISRKPYALIALTLILFSTGSAQVHELKAQAAEKKAQSHLDSLMQNREYPELERLLPEAHLDETDRAYFHGVLANRHSELETSITLLQSVIPKLKLARPDRAAVALRAMADDYVKSFRYGDADHAYSELLSEFSKHLKAAERKSLEDDAKTNHLLIDTPPQTVEFTGTFSLPTDRSKIGTIESDFTVNDITKSWILDTGANFSVLTESAARQMGLKVSEKTASTQGSSGAENKLHIAIVPEMKIGTATVHNIVVLVLADKSLKIPLPSGEYQIEAILGYPVLSALGQLTFMSNNRVVAQAGGDKSGAVVYMQELNPLLQVRIGGRDLLMLFDTGASSTTFTYKYYRAFPGQFVGLSKHPHGVAGAGGAKRVSAYALPSVQLDIGGQKADLKDASVFAEPIGTDFDLLYGTVGRDLTALFKSFTLDFKTMRFRVQK